MVTAFASKSATLSGRGHQVDLQRKVAGYPEFMSPKPIAIQLKQCSNTCGVRVYSRPFWELNCGRASPRSKCTIKPAFHHLRRPSPHRISFALALFPHTHFSTFLYGCCRSLFRSVKSQVHNSGDLISHTDTFWMINSGV
jgi:hypothetical protein